MVTTIALNNGAEGFVLTNGQAPVSFTAPKFYAYVSGYGVENIVQSTLIKFAGMVERPKSPIPIPDYHQLMGHLAGMLNFEVGSIDHVFLSQIQGSLSRMVTHIQDQNEQ